MRLITHIYLITNGIRSVFSEFLSLTFFSLRGRCLIKKQKINLQPLEILLPLLLICINTQTQIYAETPPLKVTVQSHLGAGFFAELSKVISEIKNCEQLNLKELNVDWSHEFFPYKDDPTENGWDLFFEPISFDDEDNRILNSIPTIRYAHFIHDQLCIDHWMAYQEHLPYRQSINRILNKYIKIKQPIMDKFSDVYKQHLEGHYCIGVHVRWGAAHQGEAPKGTPTIASYISEVSQLMKKIQTPCPFKIYIATDSQEVIEEFQKHFPKKLLFYLQAPRSLHREESHLIYDNTEYWLTHPWEFHKKKPGYFGGLAVLLDCLLLSKCNVFIHSTSNVSEFVSFYSPHIESIYLPKDNQTWPCRYGL